MEQEIRKILRCPICEKGRIADAPAGAALSQYRLFAMVGNEPADITKPADHSGSYSQANVYSRELADIAANS